MSTTRAATALSTAANLHTSPPRPAPTGAPARSLPRLGTVILCPATLRRWLAATIDALPEQPIVAGWIDTTPRATTPALAPHDEPEAPHPLGDLRDLPLLRARFNLRAAVLCPAGLSRDQESELSATLRDLGLDVRLIPAPETLLAPPAPLSARNTYTAAPSIDLARLIGRQPHAIDRHAVAKALAGKRVLVTGAGGSIGSELALLAADFAPESVILLERAENALFEIDRRIARRHPTIARRAILHDVVDDEATLRLLTDLRPHVVFHAAAHKHVPLMEDHPGHAVTNNLFGTKSIADAAVASGAERFVMISSDKAVNPTSVMGATKRMAEMYVRSLGRPDARTRLSMVRFGNVLGSACSVLTIWSSQIAEALAPGLGGGAPLTITDPRMTRYFMTIPEAATLVMQSMVVESENHNRGVGVYVLDMGEPIRILELACRFIRAHGAAPRIDAATAAQLFGSPLAARLSIEFPGDPADADRPPIDIVFTGARPGEKIHEELAYAAELLTPTTHPGVRSWAGPGFTDADACLVQAMVAEMSGLRFSQDRSAIVEGIRRHVPEMRSV
ncbi:MAG: polysaccharide biosynthesis protein [Phycisphaerales bacterium]